MSKTKIFLSFAIFAIVAVTGFGFATLRGSMTKSWSDRVLPKLTKWTGATPQEMSHIMTILQGIQPHKQMRDEEIECLVKFVGKPKESLPEMGMVIRSAVVFEPLSKAIQSKCLSDKQKEQVYQAALPHLSSSDKTGAEPIAAMTIMYALKDKRCVPMLLPLLNSPNTKVREYAKKVLKHLGCSV